MKIAIVDSGIYSGHPHVGRVAGRMGDDYVDRLGHGTAVAAAIREKVEEAEIYAVKVFDRRLSAEIGVLIAAIEWCIENQMDLINLSLGTENPAHRTLFEAVLNRGPLVVSVADMLPGSLPGAIPVAADADCPRDTYYRRDGIYYASPYPRPIPGVPVERNLMGPSFAVANVTGLLARELMAAAPGPSP